MTLREAASTPPPATGGARHRDPAQLDYGALMKEGRRVDLSGCTRTVRVALLSDATVNQLVPLLTVLLARRGVRAEVYLGEYDATELEVFNEHSDLYAFRPDVVVILGSTNALRLKYYGSAENRAGFGDEVAAKIESLWRALASHTSAVVLQANYVLPYERQFGNFDHKVPESLYATVAALNRRIAEMAQGQAQVLVNDVEALASYVGRKHWCDERLWTLCKAFCSFEHLPLVAQNIADVVAATAGQVVKCVVLDLDNTLWGGVIGDDGPEGIAIGPYGDGEPFHRLQFYLRELKRRGILLAVCSKNDYEVAIEPFRTHPEMVLREADIAVFVANWDPKPDNIRSIRETLNIGLDAMVFLDDNPFERNLVREALPEVIVPELPEDPSDYVRAIAELNLFEATSFSEEDRRRADLYRDEARRRELATSCTDITAYLRSLDMRIVLERFDEFHLSRVVQLLQRSNQFNLTTRRYQIADCRAMMEAPDTWVPWYLKLADKFGDNGLISVVILKPEPPDLRVDSWLMSCRVLGRGVEAYAMNRVVELARQHGCDAVVGEYLPTAKNRMVKDFYQRFGFAPVEERPDGGAVWRLDVSTYAPQDVYMVGVTHEGGRRSDDGAG